MSTSSAQSRAGVERLAATLLYEGYVLYPYRRSSVKNRRRFNFGVVHPRAWSEAHPDDAWTMQTEVLVEGARPRVTIRVRFLELAEEGGWHEARERTIEIAGEAGESLFAWPAPDGNSSAALSGRVLVESFALAPELKKLRVRIENTTPLVVTPSREAALLHSLASTHTIFTVEDGQFVSLLEPAAELEAAAKACDNRGTWPVLVGDRSTMLSSPIILYDHPAIAPESPGDLFDGCEIDEILTLRILTLTDEEKAEVRASDPRAAQLLDRTENLDAADLARLHGAMRELRPVLPNALGPGDRVRLHPRGPRGCADAFDLFLDGKAATVAAVEQDLEGRLQYAVTIDEDPGADLGARGFPGHRFFFRPDEVERS